MLERRANLALQELYRQTMALANVSTVVQVLKPTPRHKCANFAKRERSPLAVASAKLAHPARSAVRTVLTNAMCAPAVQFQERLDPTGALHNVFRAVQELSLLERARRLARSVLPVLSALQVHASVRCAVRAQEQATQIRSPQATQSAFSALLASSLLGTAFAKSAPLEKFLRRMVPTNAISATAAPSPLCLELTVASPTAAPALRVHFRSEKGRPPVCPAPQEQSAARMVPASATLAEKDPALELQLRLVPCASLDSSPTATDCARNALLARSQQALAPQSATSAPAELLRWLITVIAGTVLPDFSRRKEVPASLALQALWHPTTVLASALTVALEPRPTKRTKSASFASPALSRLVQESARTVQLGKSP